MNKKIFSIISQNPIHPTAPAGAWITENWVYDKIKSLPSINGVSLETGGGASTLFFALSSVKQHFCLVPSAEEVEKIKAAAREAQVSLDKVEFKIANSAQTLTSFSTPLDFIFIDGCHGPFVPFLDFYLSVKNLNKGGHVLIDDLGLIAPKLVFELIQNEPSVDVLAHNEKAALVQIHDTQFLDHDWWQSSINYSSTKPILSDGFFSTCVKFKDENP
jgi:Methyltransferase domain